MLSSKENGGVCIMNEWAFGIWNKKDCDGFNFDDFVGVTNIYYYCGDAFWCR